MEDNLLERDRIKTAEYLAKADTGGTAAGLSPEQQEAINNFVVEQRDKYADHALRSKSLQKDSPEYLEHIQGMNQVKVGLANLAEQQKAFAENQVAFMNDFNNDLISKANYMPGGNSEIASVYRNERPVFIDPSGNLMFEFEQEIKPYSSLAEYSLKDFDTANSILNIADKLYSGGQQMTEARKGILENQIKNMIDKGGRSTAVSLLQDGLVPGFENVTIPEELYQPENYAQLKDFIVSNLGTAFEDVANQGYNYKQQQYKLKQQRRQQGKGSSGSGSSKIGGKTSEERQAIAVAAGALIKNQEYQGKDTFSFTYKGSNDANSQEYTLKYFPEGPSNLTLAKGQKSGAGLYYKQGGALSKWMPISQEDLNKELGL